MKQVSTLALKSKTQQRVETEKQQPLRKKQQKTANHKHDSKSTSWCQTTVDNMSHHQSDAGTVCLLNW